MNLFSWLGKDALGPVQYAPATELYFLEQSVHLQERSWNQTMINRDLLHKDCADNSRFSLHLGSSRLVCPHFWVP